MHLIAHILRRLARPCRDCLDTPLAVAEAEYEVSEPATLDDVVIRLDDIRNQLHRRFRT